MSRRPSTKTADVNLGNLIDRLSPANNRWREGSPAEKVLALWDTGDELLRNVDGPRDDLLWEMQDRSYMTRNMLRYALIVRRAWASRAQLGELVAGLKSYTLFREALPFLKGDRAGADEQTYARVVGLLSSRDVKSAVRQLRSMKHRAIGRRHRKGAAVDDAQEDAARFVSAYAALVQQAKIEDKQDLLGDEDLVVLSQAAMAVALGNPDNALVPSLERIADAFPALTPALCRALSGGRGSVSTFRKLIGPARLIAAADLFNSLRSPEGLEAWRARRGQSMAL